MAATTHSTSTALRLSQELLSQLSQHGNVRTYPAKTILIYEGDDSNSLFVIVSGRVKVYLCDNDGREVTLTTQGPGEYFGEMVLDGGLRSASVVTLEPTQCLVLPHGEVEEFVMCHPDFALQLIRDLMRRTRRLTENVRNLALLDVYGRVARVLLELAHEVDGRLVIAERLTQQDIANRVGASREMVSRILKDLERGGYIHQEGGRFLIDRTPPSHW